MSVSGELRQSRPPSHIKPTWLPRGSLHGGDSARWTVPVGPFLIITRHEVGLDPDAPTKIDSQYLLQALSAVRSTQSLPANISANDLQTLADAAAPHQGEFLAGFYAPNAPLFEEWMLAEREHLRLELGNVLHNLADYSLAFGDYAAAEAHARRQLELDSYRETAHRQLMTSLVLSGRRAEADAHYETLTTLLESELDLEPAPKTQELFAKIQAGETISPAISKRFQVSTDNLPESLTPFVGRETELAAITAQLAAPNCRLLTLHGPGGVGKTRLALEFARRRRRQYVGDIFFVSLSSLTSPTNLIPTIASAIGLHIKPRPNPQKQLLRFLQERQLLLLLDNFEHLKEAAVLLVDMLRAAPQLIILVTSRDRLQLAAENLFEVSGLRTGSADGEIGEQDPEAVQMFEIYARRVRPQFQMDVAERTAVAGLCRLVEGMPLAIELAAAWVFALSPAEILHQIAAGSRLLETDYADVPPRLRSVRASFNYSWGLLSHDEQQALMRLSVFRGGCTLSPAKGVVRVDSGILASLVDKSILTYDPAVDRYYMHELIRQLAAERLQASGKADEAKREHAHYFLSKAWRAWIKVERTRVWENYYQQIAPDLHNFRVALERSLAAGEAETALKIATALSTYLVDLAMEEEAIRILERALAAGGEQCPAKIRAAACLRLAEFWPEVRGDREFSIELAERGLALYRQIGDQEGIAYALYGCGLAYHFKDYDRARAYSIQAMEAYKAAGLEPIPPLFLLGKLETLCGNFEQALSLITQRRAIYEKQANEVMLKYIDNDMARVYYYQGRLDEAQTLAEKSLRYLRAHEIKIYSTVPLNLLIQVALDKGQLNHARVLFLERLQLEVKSNSNSVEAITLLNLVAEWLLLTSYPRQAAFWLGCFDHAREWASMPVEPVALPHYQWLVSEIHHALGKEAFTAACEEGYTVPVEDALPLALQAVEQTSPESASTAPNEQSNNHPSS